MNNSWLSVTSYGTSLTWECGRSKTNQCSRLKKDLSFLTPLTSTPCTWSSWMCRNACWSWICPCLWCCCCHDVRWGTWSVTPSLAAFYSPRAALGDPDVWSLQRHWDRHGESWCTPPCRPQTVQGKTILTSAIKQQRIIRTFSLKGGSCLPFWRCRRCQWEKQRSLHIWRPRVCTQGHSGTRCCRHSPESSGNPCWSQWSCCLNIPLDLQETS